MRIEHWLYSVPLRLRALFRRRQVEQDLNDELQYHLEQKTRDFLSKGLSPEQSRLAALRSMDGLTLRQEECRDARGLNALDNTLQDIRYGLRVLRKSPGFTAVAILTLALAIGANAVVFGVVNAALLRPLNLPHEDTLFAIEHGRALVPSFSYPDYIDIRDRNRSFDGLAGFSIDMVGLDTGGNPTRAWILEVSGNYFDVLEIQPFLGRFFHTSDEHGPNSAPYIVLSHGYWHTHFQDDPGVVGRTVQVNKHPFTIVGVAPPEFRGTLLFLNPDFFLPIVHHEQLQGASTLGMNLLQKRSSQWVLMVMGHLKPGVTAAQAVPDLNSIGGWLEKTYPKDDGDMKFTLARPGLVGDYLGRPVRAFITVLTLLAGLILLAACANLGSLFAARAADRGREVALRLALGASRNRILRQLFTEAVLISLMGGAVGLLGSVILLRRLSVWQPVPRFPARLPVAPDANVYVVAIILSVVTGILFGLVPLRQVRRTDPYQIIKTGSTAMLSRRMSVRDLLLGVQIAVCAVLVTCSMVAARGLSRSLHTDYGFQPQNAMLLNTNLVMGGYTSDAAPGIQKRMLDAMAAIPGVTAAGLIDRTPLGGDRLTTTIYTDDMTDLRPSNAVAVSMLYTISTEYFRAAGTTLLTGRQFTQHDDKSVPRVSIINREFARRIFGSVGDALGRYYKRRDGTRYQVVGVVENGKYEYLSEDPQPAIFFPILQSPSSDSWMVVRSTRDPQQLAEAMRATLRNLDPGLPFYIQTWNQQLDLAHFTTRVVTMALGVLGVMGVVLSITGIFGMAAYAVSKRMKELGIRVALGARGQEVLQAALGRALKLLAIGSGAGVLLGVLASPLLAKIIFHATPRDPVVLAGVIAAMFLLGLIATWIPAQRALSVDPLRLLREE